MCIPKRPASRIPELCAYPSVGTQDLHHGSLCTFTEWACLENAPELREERSMPFFSLAVIQEGTFVHHTPDGAFPCHPGMIRLLAADCPYWATHPHGLDRGCRIRLPSELVLEALETLQPRVAEAAHAGRRLLPVSRPCPPGALLRLAVLLARAAEADPLAFEETALELLDAVLQPSSQHGALPHRRSTLEQQRHWVQQAQLLLAHRFEENLPLAEVARAVHTSPFHLSRIFKRETGRTLHQYRNRVRLAVGLDRLLSGEKDLTRLALELGYSSHSHFTRAFSTEFGLPPSEARRLPVRKR